MDIKDVITNNLESLHDKYKMNQTAFANYCGLQQRTYNRIINKESLAKLDQLDRVAKKCHIEVWQLLVPTFSADNPPMLESQSIKQQEWYANMKKVAQELVKYENQNKE